MNLELLIKSLYNDGYCIICNKKIFDKYHFCDEEFRFRYSGNGDCFRFETNIDRIHFQVNFIEFDVVDMIVFTIDGNHMDNVYNARYISYDNMTTGSQSVNLKILAKNFTTENINKVIHDINKLRVFK